MTVGGVVLYEIERTGDRKMTVEQKAEEYLKAQCQKRKEEFVIRMPEVYVADIPQAFIDGYHECQKEHEWHYVKDELPLIKKEYCGRSELVLVVSKNKQMQYAQYVEKEKTWARGICAIGFEPYAWKEIVLPELPKEIE